MTSRDQQEQRCSFCRKPQVDVKTLIGGPGVFICDECVDICSDILAKGHSGEAQVADVFETRHFGPLVRCRLCQILLPKEACVAFPERGWLCSSCVVAVRQDVGAIPEVPK